MIVPIRTEFENFLSFKKKQELKFHPTGIHFITGVNYDVDIDNNEFTEENYNVGVGKSSLAMVMQFAFYGEIQKNVNKDHIINKYAKRNLYVQFDFLLSSTQEIYRIERYRKHDLHRDNFYLYKFFDSKFNDVSGIDKKETQEMINKLIILDIKTFEKSVLFTREDKTQFLELSSTYRGGIFENIAQIARIKTYYDKAKKKNKEIEDQLLTTNNEVIKIATIIDRDKKWIEEILQEERTHKEAILSDIQDLQNKIHELTSMDKPVDEILGDIKQYKDIAAELDELRKDIKFNWEKMNGFKGAMAADKKNEEIYSKLLEDAQTDCDNHHPKKCHQCGAIQDPTEFDVEHNEKIMNIKRYEDSLNSARNSYKLNEEQFNSYQDIVERLRIDETGLEHRLSNIKLPENLIDNDDTVSDVYELNQKVQLKQHEFNSIDISQQVKTIEEEISKHREILVALRDQRNELLRQQAMFSFWIQALDFKNENSLKQYIVSRVIPLFNNFVQQMVDAVYKGDLTISFDTFFNETIVYNGAQYRYDELSTGEKMKLNFCVNLAIFDLTRVNLDGCSVIFLDEIFNNVDSPSIIAFLNIIRDRYSKENAVYLISHQSEIKENLNPDSIIRIEKRNRASEIVSS